MSAQGKIVAGADIVAPAVYMAISNVMEHMAKEGIAKDQRNSQQGYNFRGIDSVYNALCSVMASNRLMMLPFVIKMEREERQTQKGGVLNYTILTVDFKLVSAIDGSSDTVRMIGEAMDSADKSSNKAQSAAMKYAALQVFMIPTEGDNDADATTHDLAAREERKPEPSLITQPQWAKIIALLEATSTRADAVLKRARVDDLKKLTDAQAIKAINLLEDKLAKMARDQSNQAGQSEGEFAANDIPY